MSNFLTVDFNRRDKRGLIPAVVQGSRAWELQEGDLVLAEDAEGTRCKAHIEEVRLYPKEGKAVAYLMLIPGTVEPNTRYDWIIEDLDRTTSTG